MTDCRGADAPQQSRVLLHSRLQAFIRSSTALPGFRPSEASPVLLESACRSGTFRSVEPLPRTVFVFCCAAWALSTASAQPPTQAPDTELVRIVAPEPIHPTLAYAAQEVRELVGKHPGIEGWSFVLEVDPRLPAYAMAVSCPAGQQRISCRGADPASALHAVYTALGQAGVLFDITGPVLPRRLALERLSGTNTVVHPAVRRRAVRLHMNFPMDISSYAADEARRYIRNLSRMRFNEVTFHSYPNDWYPSPRQPAGRFFLGVRYDIGDDALLRKHIRNKKVFCIPEIEDACDTPQERGRLAVGWLNGVMEETRRAGMRVRLSLEWTGADGSNAVSQVQSVLQSYPRVDCLELIGNETLESRDQDVDAASVAQSVAAGISAGASSAGKTGVPLPGIFQTIVGNTRLVMALRERLPAESRPGFSVGVYCPARKLHRAAVPIMRRNLPPDVQYCMMLAHGARVTVENAKAIPLTADDWQRAMLYSWIEFDGSMYIQQNPIEAIRDLVAYAMELSGGKAVEGIGLNHWRTAENRTTFQYAARALIEGPIEPAVFYREYAAALRIGALEPYAAAMAKLDAADNRAREELFNIGFCWNWGHKGLGRVGGWDRAILRSVADDYQSATVLTEQAVAKTDAAEARAYLLFLLNRTRCSVLHLQAVAKLAELQPLCQVRPAEGAPSDTRPRPAARNPSDLTDAEREAVRNICDQSTAIMRQYMELHAEMLPDRGCEGTLINYTTVPPAIARRIRSEYGEVPEARSSGR